MKVSDAIRECIYYPYSRENYELTEMAYRISLMEQFVKNQRFINSIDDSTSAVMYESGMYGDRVSEEMLESVIMEAGDDKVTLWNKIQMGASKMIQWIKDLFFKIALRFDKSLKQAREIANTLKEKKINAELWNKLNKVCLDAMDEDKKRFRPYPEQPFQLELQYLNDVKPDDQKVLTARLCAALSDSEVKAQAMGSVISEDIKDKDEIARYIQAAAPPEEIVNKLYDFVKGSKTSIEQVNKELSELSEKAEKEGLTIQVNPKAIEDMANRLKKIMDQMDIIQNKTKGSTGSSDENKEESQNESYWYDFDPEYLYEGFYSDWDPIYGDPFVESEAGQKKKDERARKKELRRQARTGKISGKGKQGSFNDLAKAAENINKKVEADPNKEQSSSRHNRKRSNVIHLGSGGSDTKIAELEKKYREEVLKYKVSRQNAEYNEALRKWREEVADVMKTDNITEADLTPKFRKLLSEENTPFLKEGEGMSDIAKGIIDKITPKVDAIEKMSSSDPAYPQKIKEIRKDLDDAKKAAKTNNFSKTEIEAIDKLAKRIGESTGKYDKDVDDFKKSKQYIGLKSLQKILHMDKIEVYVADVAANAAEERISDEKAKAPKKKLGAKVAGAIKKLVGINPDKKVVKNARQIAQNMVKEDRVKIDALVKKVDGDPEMTWKKLKSSPEDAKIMGTVDQLCDKYKVIIQAYNRISGDNVQVPEGGTGNVDIDTIDGRDGEVDEDDAVSIKGLNQAYAMLKQKIGQTMNVYLAYAHYRSKVITGVADVLNLNSDSESNEKEAS